MKIGKIQIDKGALLAPMEGITDLPFRIICKRMGADIVYSEFISSEALIRDARKSMAKMEFVKMEKPVAIQIFGHIPESMAGGAKVVERSGADILDLNFGCWVKKVVNKGAGAGMLRDLDRMGETVRAVAEAVDIPVTVKTRLGWSPSEINILEAAKVVEQAGAKAISVHCRTRDMAMKGDADWSWIPKIKQVVDIPVILNGDVKTPEDARRAFEEFACDAVMIGRAAVGNPFIFKRCKQFLRTGGCDAEPTFEDRIDVCLEHLRLTIDYVGFPRGLYEFRKHYTGYLKGLFGASKVRQRLVVEESLEDIHGILEEFRAFLRKKEEEVHEKVANIE